jgi:hypothetical protein
MQYVTQSMILFERFASSNIPCSIIQAVGSTEVGPPWIQISVLLRIDPGSSQTHNIESRRLKGWGRQRAVLFMWLGTITIDGYSYWLLRHTRVVAKFKKPDLVYRLYSFRGEPLEVQVLGSDAFVYTSNLFQADPVSY